MNETTNQPVTSAPCCEGTAAQACECKPVAGLAEGDHTAVPRSTRLQTLIAIIVLVAAVAVGGYSVYASRARAGGPRTSAPANAAVGVPTTPGPTPAAPACCGGGANVAQPAQPANCGGGANVAQPAQPANCGGGAAVPTRGAAAAGGQPSCGAASPGCCGK